MTLGRLRLDPGGVALDPADPHNVGMVDLIGENEGQDPPLGR